MTRCLNLPRHWLALLSASVALFAPSAPAHAAGVLDQIRQSGKLSLGYRADERPFSFATSAGAAPAGFSVALCQRIADAVKAELKLPALQIEWVPVSAADRFESVRQGRIQIDCGTDTPTLQRRTIVDFSIPIAMAGIGALMRTDGDWRVRDILSGRATPTQPVWRGNPGEFGGTVTFAVIGGSTIEKDLQQALAQRRIVVKTISVASFAEGVQAVLDRRATVMFGERPVLADAALRGPGAGQLSVLDRRFSRTTLALALPLGDTDLRWLVDRSLSRLYRSPDFGALYAASFGALETPMAEFYQLIALPE
jgi:ABC-type amino acid transport substrate-binding protein